MAGLEKNEGKHELSDFQIVNIAKVVVKLLNLSKIGGFFFSPNIFMLYFLPTPRSSFTYQVELLVTLTIEIFFEMYYFEPGCTQTEYNLGLFLTFFCMVTKFTSPGFQRTVK